MTPTNDEGLRPDEVSERTMELVREFRNQTDVDFFDLFLIRKLVALEAKAGR